MVDFSNISDPNKSVESVGASLLAQAQQNTRNRQRRRNPSTSDMLKNVGAQLAGYFVGEHFRHKMDNDLAEHLNSESELQRRALVKSSVDDANTVIDMNRAALKHAGGLKGYLQEQRTQSNLAYLQQHYAGKPISSTAMQALAVNEAKEGLDEAVGAFNKRVALAQKLQSETAGDPLAYTKAVREASGADEGLLIRGVKRMFSHLRDTDNKDIDNAIYRSETTSRIYKASEEYRNAFDNLYLQTASAEAASNITSALKKTGELPLASFDPKPVSMTTIDEFGETRTETWMQMFTATGTTAGYVNSQGRYISAETWKATKTDNNNQGSRLPQKRALQVFADASESVNKSVFGELRRVVDAKLPNDATSDQRNFQQAVIGEQLYLTNKSLNMLFGDTAGSNRTMDIAVRSQILDRNAFEGRPTLLAGNLKENALVTWRATIESFDDYDDVPPTMRQAMEANITKMFTQQIPNMSKARVRELYEFADTGNLFGSGTSYRLQDATTGQKMTIVDALEIILKSN